MLDVKGLTALHPSGGYKLNDVTFTLSKGEVIGIYGLLGAGRTELFKGLVGLMPCQRGEVHLNGESIGKSRFQQRLKKGLALVPEDRQGEGVVQMMSIQANMTLSDFSLQGFRRAWRWLNPQKRRDLRERDDPAAGDQGQRRHIAHHLAERRQSTKSGAG
ncbi:ATP-binding cassette domain-containing protein [Klebsiella pneumoniae subsp. pneumoniae]|nr:ATP-binding cassette domain-containing protein [Klebsiella pneumoniae subsp. pneumoniae]